MTQSLEQQREELRAIVAARRANYIEGIALARRLLRGRRAYKMDSGRLNAQVLHKDIQLLEREEKSLRLLLEDIPNKEEAEVSLLLRSFREAEAKSAEKWPDVGEEISSLLRDYRKIQK